MTYQEAVKALRKKMIMSQMEFAEYLGVSFASVNRWKRNRFEPTIKAKRKLQPLFEKYKIEIDD